MMPIVVRDGERACRVGIAHWWSLRNIWWEDACGPFPAYVRNRAYRMRSRYMTLVRVGRLLKSMGLKMERA